MSRGETDRALGHKKDEVDVVGFPERPSSFRIWALFVAGPVIWIVHFMLVYLVAEAVCSGDDTGDRAGVEVAGLPLVPLVTVVATVLAVVAIGVVAVVAYRALRAQRQASAPPDAPADPATDPGEPADPADEGVSAVEADHRDGVLALASVLLALMFALAVLYVGLPALWLQPC